MYTIQRKNEANNISYKNYNYLIEIILKIKGENKKKTKI